MPRISVCITHYNRPHKLAATLESLARQTRLPDEVFLRDDCSPNDPATVALNFKNRFPSFTYQRNPQNLNMPGNLNAVIKQATGDYIATLHDADTYHPQLLEKWERALDDHPTAGFVFCGVENRFENPARTPEVHLHSIRPLTPGKEFFVTHYVGSLSSPVWGTIMARRDAYELLGPFDPSYGPWADVDMWMRMCNRFDVAYVREALMFLDMGDSEWRKFTWEKKLLHDAMVTTNIRRIFAHDLATMRGHLRKQRSYFRQRYFRLLLGRIWHRDWEQICAGLALFGRLFFRPSESELSS